MTALVIRPAVHEDLPVFFAYLNDHLSDNGVKGTALFMPMPRQESRYPPDKEGSFRTGIATPLGKPHWRRLWLALDAEGAIAGHIDLRARLESAAAHRVLLGMGVDRAYRRQGLGATLIGTAARWAQTQPAIEWIDLEVLSVNEAARALYARCGFVQVGEIADMFRIDGQTLGYTFMTRKIG